MPPEPQPYLRDLAAYEWEASTAEIARLAGIAESDVVRFDTNTAAWPPVAWERTVLDLPRLPANEYPHPSNEPLRSAIAGRLQVGAEQVVVTNGADEALYLLAAAYLGPGRRAVVAVPSFSMFRVVTESTGAALVGVEVDAEWQMPLERTLKALDDERVRLVWLCSPNNPTGQVLSASFVQSVAQHAPHALVVLDEAYVEIAGRTHVSLVPELPNLAVVRTFSKGYGLAGARVGYLVAPRPVTAVIDAIRLPQNLSAFGIAAAHRAWIDEAGLEERVAAIRSERARLGTYLEGVGWEVVPSEANFLLAKPPYPAADLARWLQGRGMVVRSYAGHPRLGDYLRTTVRSPDENQRLLAALETYAREGVSAQG